MQSLSDTVVRQSADLHGQTDGEMVKGSSGIREEDVLKLRITLATGTVASLVALAVGGPANAATDTEAPVMSPVQAGMQ